MTIKVLSFSCEIDDLRDGRIFSLEIAQQYPGALWVRALKNRCPFDFEFQTVDKTLQLIRDGNLDPRAVAVFQHNLDRDASKLIGLGALPFLLSMYESPLYCGEFYDLIELNTANFRYVKVFGSNLLNYRNCGQAYFPSFSQSELNIARRTSDWEMRKFSSMVMGNKYVLTKSLTSFHNIQDWIWWLLKFIRQVLNGHKLSSKLDIRQYQLQDARYEILIEMLKRGLLDLYGNGWEKLIRIPPSIAKKLRDVIPRNKIEPIKDKHKIISAYKFNICFENIAYPGYITEKIIDAIMAKTIPVYYGAPDASVYIPPNAFIDASKFDSVDRLIDYLIEITPSEADVIIQNGQIFLKSSMGLKFSYEEVADEIINLLDQFIKDQSMYSITHNSVDSNAN